LRRLSILTGLIIACIVTEPVHGAVRGSEVMYVGGTLSNIPEKTEGKLELESDTAARFIFRKSDVSIPYRQITSLEYGQKAGRRVGVALAVAGPLALFSKKRKHYLTIGYSDSNGSKQGIVLELAKGTVHRTVTVLETKSGKTLEFESDDARKHFAKGAK
jgi:hypothetical protein